MHDLDPESEVSCKKQWSPFKRLIMYSIVAPCNYLWFLLLVPEVCLINVKPYNNWWFARPHTCFTKIPPDEIRLVVWWFESHKLYKGRRWCQHRLLIQVFVYLPKPFVESQVIIVNPHCIIQGCRPGVQCECLEYFKAWRGKSHHVWRIQISGSGKWPTLSSFIQLYYWTYTILVSHHLWKFRIKITTCLRRVRSVRLPGFTVTGDLWHGHQWLSSWSRCISVGRHFCA